MRVGKILYVKANKDGFKETLDLSSAILSKSVNLCKDVPLIFDEDLERCAEQRSVSANTTVIDARPTVKESVFKIDAVETLSPSASEEKRMKMRKVHPRIYVTSSCSCNNILCRVKVEGSNIDTFISSLKVEDTAKIILPEEHACPNCGERTMRVHGSYMTHLYTDETESKITASVIISNNELSYRPLTILERQAAQENERDKKKHKQAHDINLRNALASYPSTDFCPDFELYSMSQHNIENFDPSFAKYVEVYPYTTPTKYVLTYNKLTEKLYLTAKLNKGRVSTMLLRNASPLTDYSNEANAWLTTKCLAMFDQENAFGFISGAAYSDFNNIEPGSGVVPGALLKGLFFERFMSSEDTSVSFVQRLANEAYELSSSSQRKKKQYVLDSAMHLIASPINRTLPFSSINLQAVPSYARSSKRKTLKALFPAFSKSHSKYFFSNLKEIIDAEGELPTSYSHNRPLKRTVIIGEIDYMMLHLIDNPDLLTQAFESLLAHNNKFKFPYDDEELKNAYFFISIPKDKYRENGASLKQDIRLLNKALTLKFGDRKSKIVLQHLKANNLASVADLIDDLKHFKKKSSLNRMLEEVDARSIEQLHMRLSRIRARDVESENIVHYDPILKENLTFSNDTYTIYPVCSTLELRIIGEEMHHCVGTYVRKVIEGKNIIIAVKNNITDEYEICMDLRTTGLDQVKLKYNARLKPEHKELIATLQQYFKLAPIVSGNILRGDLFAVAASFEMNVDLEKLLVEREQIPQKGSMNPLAQGNPFEVFEEQEQDVRNAIPARALFG